MGDGYWLEPETLKKKDNQKLLINIFNWLAKKNEDLKKANVSN
jgi:hypothetical protein